VSPVRYELGFYIPEGDILHSHCPETLKLSGYYCYYYPDMQTQCRGHDTAPNLCTLCCANSANSQIEELRRHDPTRDVRSYNYYSSLYSPGTDRTENVSFITVRLLMPETQSVHRSVPL
jgi:hypothetical protein